MVRSGQAVRTWAINFAWRCFPLLYIPSPHRLRIHPGYTGEYGQSLHCFAFG
jgi:hypothetical protein